MLSGTALWVMTHVGVRLLLIISPLQAESPAAVSSLIKMESAPHLLVAFSPSTSRNCEASFCNGAYYAMVDRGKLWPQELNFLQAF